MRSEPEIIKTKVHYDDRGCFLEIFNKEIGAFIGAKFCQDNLSISAKGVIRGLHYQWDRPQGKLVSCVKGRVLDVLVDIRALSKTLGKVLYFDLNETNKDMLWVPPGFAHGFQALEESALLYKCTSLYNLDGESGICPLDEELQVGWSPGKHILSKKDAKAKCFSEYLKNPRF